MCIRQGAGRPEDRKSDKETDQEQKGIRQEVGRVQTGHCTGCRQEAGRGAGAGI